MAKAPYKSRKYNCRPRLPAGAHKTERCGARLNAEDERRLRRLSARRGQLETDLILDGLRALEERDAVLPRLLQLLKDGDAVTAVRELQGLLDRQAGPSSPL